VPQVLAHLGGAGGAVQPDAVDAQRLQSSERGPDLAAEQHRPGGLHGHLDDDGQVLPRRRQRPLGADDRGLGLQEVLRGLDEDGVDAAVDEAADLLGVGVAEPAVVDVAERGQLGARPDRPEDEAGLLGRRPGVGRRAGDLGARPGELVDPVLEPYSPRLPRLAPKVFVSTASTPTAR
jgi:hypothetical protein